jgi:hypothetical protein
MLFFRVSSTLASQGLEYEWIPMGATTFYTDNKRSRKEGDSTGGPSAQRGDGDSWPTLVIEAGASQSLNELRQTMRWWFSASNHKVKIVVLAKLRSQTQQIVLEKWQEASQQPSRVTRATSSVNNLLVPRLEQEITIDKIGQNPLDHLSYNVTRGALRLSFELLFLRPPGPGEHDVVVDYSDLQRIASQVWR